MWVIWNEIDDQWTTLAKPAPEYVAIAVSPLLLVRVGSLVDRVVVYLTEEVAGENDTNRIQRCIFLLQRLVHMGYEEVLDWHVTDRGMDFCKRMDEAGLIADPASLEPLNTKVVMALEVSPATGYLRFSTSRNLRGDHVSDIRIVPDAALRTYQPKFNPPVIQ